MKKINHIFIFLSLFTSLCFAQLTVKDQESTPNTLLQVVDEGTSGSVILPPLSSITDPAGKLYNNGGNLYWGPNQIGIAGSADNDWTISGNNIYNSNTGNIGIGTTNPQSLLSVGGAGHNQYTIYARTSLSDGTGILGEASNAGVGTNYGGFFLAHGSSGHGVYGSASGIDGHGVSGNVTGDAGRAVYGYASNNGDVENYGGYFKALGEQGCGVYGNASNPMAINNIGGWFTASGSYGYGVFGNTSGDFGRGVAGSSSGKDGRGVSGTALNTGEVYNYGGYFISEGLFGTGVHGAALNFGEATNYGGYFRASGSSGRGVYGYANNNGEVTNFGGYFEADGVYGRGVLAYVSGSDATGVFARSDGANGRGIYAFAPNTGYAGYFVGRLNATGAITGASKSFKIDHPLDPENKYLLHTSVESPYMMNIYNGNVTTDANGNANIELPEWFEALNKDFRYQLTVIGEFAQAIVSKEINNNEFSIKTNKPNVKVSWQVTGIRHDAWANENRTVVEENKPDKEKGKYLHPAAFNMPKTASVDFDEKMELEKTRMKEEHERMEQERITMDGLRKIEKQRMNQERQRVE